MPDPNSSTRRRKWCCHYFKKQSPRYVLFEFSQFQEEEVTVTKRLTPLPSEFLKNIRTPLRNWPNEAIVPSAGDAPAHPADSRNWRQ